MVAQGKGRQRAVQKEFVCVVDICIKGYRAQLQVSLRGEKWGNSLNLIYSCNVLLIPFFVSLN